MKVVVIKEIEQLLFRQNVSLKAQFVFSPTLSSDLKSFHV